MSGITADNNVKNGGNVPQIRSGAALPATGSDNEIFLDTTANILYVRVLGSWVAFGGGGGGGTLQTVTTAGNTTTNAIYVAGFAAKYKKTSDALYNVLETDFLIAVDMPNIPGLAPVVIELPATAGNIGNIYVIKMMGPVAIGQTITVKCLGGTIDGVASYVMTLDNECITVMKIQTKNYLITAKYL